MPALFYVVGEHLDGRERKPSGRCWLLTVEGESEERAKRSIAWQNQPRRDRETRWHICTYDPAARAFLSQRFYDPDLPGYVHKGGALALHPGVGPYTAETWAHVQKTIHAAHAATQEL